MELDAITAIIVIPVNTHKTNFSSIEAMNDTKKNTELTVYNFDNLKSQGSNNCFDCDSCDSCDMCDSCDHGW